ncbi:cytochrome P450 [Pisolithus thermaeus]|nr:cytochrome P450 [Pisolithus croceorrhizus]KAI6167420.1 cytochrome P450 [Pisolithus thermaeus]
MGAATTVLSATLVLCLSAILAVRRIRAHNKPLRLPLPPGPKGLPWLGNVLSINTVEPWLTYQQWGKRYGDVVYSKALGGDYVIINNETVARELLDQRSAIYSDRPRLPSTELLGIGFVTVVMPYGDEWRLHRKLFHSVLNKEQSRKYAPMQLHRVHKFLVHLLATPQDFQGHFTTLASAIVMDIGYGYAVAPRNDPLVAKAIQLLDIIVEVGTPERTAFLSTFPFLAHIPSWMPGGIWKRRAKECRRLIRNILDDPFQYVRDRVVRSSPLLSISAIFPRPLALKTSMVQDMYEMGEDNFDAPFDKEMIIKDVAATLFLTGVEPTYFVASIFLLAMVLYPDVQKKAQEEIDRVVGTDRLPDFDDRPNLPYIEAVTLETLRWLPVTPLGIPHMTTADDVCKGMHIPRGATIVPNVWAMTRDPERFPEPDTFNPNRYLPPSGELVDVTASPVFGFGRRICPGKYLAEQGLWATIVSILATLQIGKLKDVNGNDIEVHPEFKTGIGLCPKPFPCSIKARSVEAEQLIHAAVDWNNDTSDPKAE